MISAAKLQQKYEILSFFADFMQKKIIFHIFSKKKRKNDKK